MVNDDLLRPESLWRPNLIPDIHIIHRVKGRFFAWRDSLGRDSFSVWTREFQGKPRKPQSTASRSGMAEDRKEIARIDGKAPEVAWFARNESDGKRCSKKGR